MRKDSWFRGALLSVLFFGLVAGGMPELAAGQVHFGLSNQEGGEDEPEDCGSDCTEEITVTATPIPVTQQLASWAWSRGRGYKSPSEIKNWKSQGYGGGAAANYYRRVAAAEKLHNTCKNIESASTEVALAALMAAIAAALVVFVSIPGAAILLALAAVGFAAHNFAVTWCTNDYYPWYGQHFG